MPQGVPCLGQCLSSLQAAGGLTIGVLPGSDTSEVSDSIDIPILTGMGSARDNMCVGGLPVLVCLDRP